MAKKASVAEGLPGFFITAAVGAGIAFATTLLLMAAGAGMIASGHLPEGALVRICCVGMGIGCLAGGLYAAMSLGSRLLPAALVTGAVSFALWLVIGQLMYGGFAPAGVLRSGLCALIGALTAGFMAAGGKKSRN